MFRSTSSSGFVERAADEEDRDKGSRDAIEDDMDDAARSAGVLGRVDVKELAKEDCSGSS